MSGAQLRTQIRDWGYRYAVAAEQLGLSLSGLQHQMRSERPISQQTAMLLEYWRRDRVRMVLIDQLDKSTSRAAMKRVIDDEKIEMTRAEVDWLFTLARVKRNPVATLRFLESQLYPRAGLSLVEVKERCCGPPPLDAPRRQGPDAS
jgi:hypothetical protein